MFTHVSVLCQRDFVCMGAAAQPFTVANLDALLQSICAHDDTQTYITPIPQFSELRFKDSPNSQYMDRNAAFTLQIENVWRQQWLLDWAFKPERRNRVDLG